MKHLPFSRSGLIHVLSALFLHLPCCGLPLIIASFGMQTLTGLTGLHLHEYQFYIPLAVTALLTLWLFAVTKYKARRLPCDHPPDCHGHHPEHPHHQPGHHHPHSPRLLRFIILNLAIGYAIAGAMYFIMPKHDHSEHATEHTMEQMEHAHP